MTERQNALILLDAPVAQSMPLATAGDIMDRWTEALYMWLASPRRSSPATRRAYESAWRLLLSFTEKAPWSIDKSDLARWVTAMRESGMSDNTIAQRVAAVSSFYRYCMYEYEVTHPDGSRTGLTLYNPAGGESLRPEVDPYDKASGLTHEQTVALLRAIVPNTVQAMRDSVLFQLYIATGRRNTEIRTLRKCDIQVSESSVQYHWKQKRGQGWDEIPGDIWYDLLQYLEAVGRPWEDLTKEDFIFTALCDKAGRLPQMQGRPFDPYARPLSARTVGALLKKYARKAGLDPKAIHVHTLRHTTADMMIEAGFNVTEVQKRLGHKNLGTTQIYLTNRPKEKNLFWAQFKALNDL